MRVVFPSDGRWRWALSTGRETLARGAIAVSTRVGFELPYDLASAPDGTIFFVDRQRVLVLIAAAECACMRRPERASSSRWSGSPTGPCSRPIFPVVASLRFDPSGTCERRRRASAIPPISSRIATGSTLWVASIAEGVGVVRVDVASGRVEPFADVENPHGIDRDSAGNFYAHDGHAVSRIDGVTGAVTPFAAVDAGKLLVAPDGSVYGGVGNPSGGRIVRIAPDGSVSDGRRHRPPRPAPRRPRARGRDPAERGRARAGRRAP